MKRWRPRAGFDWATGGRALSSEEVVILRRLLVKDSRHAGHVRKPAKCPRKMFERE